MTDDPAAVITPPCNDTQPLPVAKSATLATQLVERMDYHTHRLECINDAVSVLYEYIAAFRTMLYTAVALFGLSLLVSIATLVFVAWLAGHVR